MRIITWNVNGIRATHKKWELTHLIDFHDPDILFMQEIKATPDKLTVELLSPEEYQVYYNPAEKPGYAGTGVWIHKRVYEKYGVTFLKSFPNDPNSNEWRVAHVTLIDKTSSNNIDLFGIYFPNGGKSEQAWHQKLIFYKEFTKYTDDLRTQGHAVLWGGDINCAHHAIDLARPKENDGKIWFHPLERAWMDACTEDGWIDLWRQENPDITEVYSWWDPVTRSRERNVGWRIDAWWGESKIREKLQHITYIPEQYWSDHCPIRIDLDI
jgi:exodeoxyribonuclease III